MRSALLGLAVPIAAIAALTLPAAAAAETQSLSTAGFAARTAFQPRPGMTAGAPSTTVRIHRGFDGDSRDGDHRRRHRDNVFVNSWVDGDWALYNNRSFEPDSYNDWWHDRPDRAYPAWMRRNKDCARQWYSADLLSC